MENRSSSVTGGSSQKREEYVEKILSKVRPDISSRNDALRILEEVQNLPSPKKEQKFVRLILQRCKDTFSRAA